MPIPYHTIRALERAKASPSFSSLSRLTKRLESAADDILPGSDNDLKAELAAMWLGRHLLCMKYHKDFYFSDSHIDILVALIVTSPDVNTPDSILKTQTALKKVVTDDETAQVLAQICLNVIAYTEFIGWSWKEAAVSNIVAAWSGKSNFTTESLTAEDVTNHLYGPAVYMLYRPEVESDISLGGLLHKYGLPLLGESLITRKTSMPVRVDMPSDIYPADQP